MTYDVIIVGAGPVGLFLATELALRKISVVVLERETTLDTPWKTSARGLNGPSVEALYRRGMLDGVRESAFMWKEHGKSDPSASQVKPKQAGHFAGISIDTRRIDFDKPPFDVRGPAASVGMVTLKSLETVLIRRAESLGVTIRRGIEVTDFSEENDGIVVRTGEDTFRGSWLVGCDGGRSTIRKKAGFDFEGTDAQLTGYVAFVEMSDNEDIKPGFHLTSSGMYLIGPQPGFLSIADFDAGAFHRTQEITLDHLQSVLRRVSNTNVKLTSMRNASTYTDQARQATTYRKGRILLAGDAAHIHSPFGGQGLNTGLIDALNLGWKLAATIHETAPPGLLDSYTAERHPAGAWTLAWTRAQVAVMRPDPFGQAISSVIRDLIDTTDGATYFASKVSGVTKKYDLPGDHELIGRSAPDMEFPDGSRLPDLLADGSALLLEFYGETPWCPKIGEKYKGRVKYASVSPTNRIEQEAMFIRPDGVVAWALSDMSDLKRDELDAALRTWIGDPQ